MKRERLNDLSVRVHRGEMRRRIRAVVGATFGALTVWFGGLDRAG